jgi:hypothetical protein
MIVTGDVAVDQAAEAFTGVFVHNGHDLDRAAVGGGVELEIHRPHHIRRIRGRWVRCRGRAETLAPTWLRHAQALVAPEPLDFLVIDLPGLSAGIVVLAGGQPCPTLVAQLGSQRSHGLRCKAGGSHAQQAISRFPCAPIAGGWETVATSYIRGSALRVATARPSSSFLYFAELRTDGRFRWPCSMTRLVRTTRRNRGAGSFFCGLARINDLSPRNGIPPSGPLSSQRHHAARIAAAGPRAPSANR